VITVSSSSSSSSSSSTGWTTAPRLPDTGADSWRLLHTVNRQLLAVPRYRLNTYGRRAFSVAGPTVWNSLPDFIRDLTISADCFRRLLKRICSLDTSAFSA